MKDTILKNEKNYFIHIIYASSFLLAVFTIIGYLVWSKYQTTVQKRIEIEQRIEIQAAQDRIKKTRTLNCVIIARKSYDENWASACTENANRIQAALKNCVNSSEKSARFISGNGSLLDYKSLYESYAAQCKLLYGTPNPKPNCLLPNSLAKGLDESLQKDEKMCAIIS